MNIGLDIDRKQWADLVRPDRVHGSAYTSQAVHDAEMKYLFAEGWAYVVHESEIAEPGDYVTKVLGNQPVIASRGKDGGINVMLNRCTHRGNLLCRAPAGNAASYRCPYHGWTFANDGALKGIPFREGYGESAEEVKRDLGLARAPRVESYGGFVFCSMAEDGPDLPTHLGRAAAAIDRLNRLSPTGQVDLSGGHMQHHVRSNWKMLMENNVDGYHALFTHASVYDSIRKPKVTHRPDQAKVYVRDMGQGHSEIDYAPEYRRLDEEFIWFGRIARDRIGSYAEDLEAAVGPDAAHEALVVGPPHTLIFPNLFLAEMNVMVLEPVSPGECIAHITPVFIPGQDILNEKTLRRTEGALGPAGFLLADDAEIAMRNQMGLSADAPEWLLLTRGLEDEFEDESGIVNVDKSTETPQRGFWRRWSDVMTGSQ